MSTRGSKKIKIAQEAWGGERTRSRAQKLTKVFFLAQLGGAIRWCESN